MGCGGSHGHKRGIQVPAPVAPTAALPALTELQVSVHNMLLVQVAQAADQAPQVVAYLRLRQSLPRRQHVGQRLQVTHGPQRQHQGDTHELKCSEVGKESASSL